MTFELWHRCKLAILAHLKLESLDGLTQGQIDQAVAELKAAGKWPSE